MANLIANPTTPIPLSINGPTQPDDAITQLVAHYPTHARARAAHESLRTAGIPADAMEILSWDEPASRTPPSAAPAKPQRLWGALKRLFSPTAKPSPGAAPTEPGRAILVVTTTPKAGLHRLAALADDTRPDAIDVWSNGWIDDFRAPAPKAAPMIPTEAGHVRLQEEPIRLKGRQTIRAAQGPTVIAFPQPGRPRLQPPASPTRPLRARPGAEAA